MKPDKRKLAIVLWLIIVTGIICLHTTYENLQEARRWADVEWNSMTFYSECTPLAEAAPDATVDSKGIVHLPARRIYLHHPLCSWNFVGAGRDRTILEFVRP